MQKKLIALAIAGLASGAAFADNASIYGVLDAAWVNTSGGGLRSANTVASGGLSASRIGFNVSEDLGNGTKVIGNLEYQLDIANSTPIGSGNAVVNSATVARQQLLGLTGSWGTFATGYLQTVSYDFGAKFDVAAGSTVSPLQNMVKGAGLTIGTVGGAARAGSAMAYISPNMSGFSAAVNYAYLNQLNVLDASGANTNKPATLLGLNYDNGPLAVGFAYVHIGNANLANTGVVANEWALGGSYNFGVATVKGTYQVGHVSGGGMSSPATNNVKAWSLGAVIPAGPGAVAISYAKLNDDTCTDCDANSYTLGYLYPMSKRTTAYVAYSHANQDNGTNSYSVDNSVLSLGGLNAGGSSSMFALGLNHKF